MDSDFGGSLRSVSTNILSQARSNETCNKVARLIADLEHLHEDKRNDTKEVYMEALYEHIGEISETIRNGQDSSGGVPKEHLEDFLKQHEIMAEYITYIGPCTDGQTENRSDPTLKVALLMKYTAAHLTVTKYILEGQSDISYKDTFVPLLEHCLKTLPESP